MSSLLYSRYIPVNKSNNDIKVIIPTVGEVIGHEDDYYGIVSAFTSMPIDYMAQLADDNIDCRDINAFELFLYLFPSISRLDVSLVFDGLDLRNFTPAISEQNGNVILLDPVNDIVIDRVIHGQIATILRHIHDLKKNIRKPANDESYDYLLERERIKRKRRKRSDHHSELEEYIVALVNTSEFKYNFETVKELSIYQFNRSLKQICRRVDFDKRMIGVYAGTVDTSKMDPADLTWIGSTNKHKEEL